MSVARAWNGASYDRISAPLEALGREVLDRLPLAGDETVLDAGCGSGRVTEALIARLPRGRVIAVDASRSMVQAARERLGARADVRLADLVELDLGGEAVDAVLSTATFHWIADHDALFSRLYAAMRPGGRLVAQCGGAGNVARVHEAAARAGAREPFAQHFDGWRGPWNFATPEETEARLRAGGFARARAWLEDRPVTPEEPREYFATIILGAHLERLPAALREPFLDTALEEYGPDPTIDYVRLNIDAVA
jgi:trans-aconitate 2-methyltransferase